MTAEQYRALAAQFRGKARNEESPAFRAELFDLAKCYEWMAEEVSRCAPSDVLPAGAETA
jgi:hypothetical protein